MSWHRLGIRPRVLRTVSLAALCVVFMLPGAAWAQGNKKKADAKPEEQSYMLPYIITAVAVLIGLAVVCMPSQRKDEVDMDE